MFSLGSKCIPWFQLQILSSCSVSGSNGSRLSGCRLVWALTRPIGKKDLLQAITLLSVLSTRQLRIIGEKSTSGHHHCRCSQLSSHALCSQRNTQNHFSGLASLVRYFSRTQEKPHNAHHCLSNSCVWDVFLCGDAGGFLSF